MESTPPLHPHQEAIIKHALVLDQHEDRFEKVEARLEKAESSHSEMSKALTTLNLNLVQQLGEIKVEMTRTRWAAMSAGALLAIDIILKFK